MIRSGVGKTPRTRAADAQGIYRAVLTDLLSDGNTVADYIAGTGVTGTLNVSSWANQIGSAPALAQGAGANQPIYLGYTGSKYAYCSGVSGNYFSTPNATANQITGDIDVVAKVAPDDWTPGGNQSIAGKWTTSGQFSWLFLVLTTGRLQFAITLNGIGVFAATSSASPTVSDGGELWVKASRVAATGTVTFYTSPDGVTWTQLGTPQATTAGSMFNSSSSIIVGGESSTATLFVGKVFRVQVYNGIGGTLAVDFNPESSSETTTNGATWTSATGETWTLNNTGSKPAQVVGSAQLLLDGAGYYMISAMGDIAKPTFYLVAKQISWTSGDKFFDSTGRVILQQYPTTPKLCLYAGALAPEDAGLSVGAYGVVCAQFNGASSLLQINGGTASVGNPGAGTTGATLYFGSDVVGGTNGNFQAKEFIVRTSTDSAATRALIYQYLKAIHGTP